MDTILFFFIFNFYILHLHYTFTTEQQFLFETIYYIWGGKKQPENLSWKPGDLERNEHGVRAVIFLLCVHSDLLNY